MSETIDYSTHWLVMPKRASDKPRVITMQSAVAEWEGFGYTVLGPFTIATPPGTRAPDGAFIDFGRPKPLLAQERVYWMCREKGIRYDDHDIGHILRTAAPILRDLS